MRGDVKSLQFAHKHTAVTEYKRMDGRCTKSVVVMEDLDMVR